VRQPQSQYLAARGLCVSVQQSAAYWLKGCSATLLGAASACQGRATAAIRPTNTPSRMLRRIVASAVGLRCIRLATLRFPGSRGACRDVIGGKLVMPFVHVAC
jgi:hypothetical protein